MQYVRILDDRLEFRTCLHILYWISYTTQLSNGQFHGNVLDKVRVFKFWACTLTTCSELIKHEYCSVCYRAWNCRNRIQIVEHWIRHFSIFSLWIKRLRRWTCCCDYKAIRQLLGAFNSPLRESLSTSVDNNFT